MLETTNTAHQIKYRTKQKTHWKSKPNDCSLKIFRTFKTQKPTQM